MDDKASTRRQSIDDGAGAPAEGQRRVGQVYAFLRAFSERRAPAVRTLDDASRALRLRDFPDHPAVRIGFVSLRGQGKGDGKSDGKTARAEEDDDDPRTADPLIRVRRPILTHAPAPPDELAEWLVRGWERAEGKIAVIDLRNRKGRGGKIVPERFVDDPARVQALEGWSRAWQRWAAAERPAREAMRIFEALYALHSDIERQGERIELVLGDGRLVWQTETGRIDHPVLLQRVDLVFDPDVPEFRVVDSDRAPELAAPLLLAGGKLSGEKVNELAQELEAGGYHPLAGNETTSFLRRLVSLLGPSGAVRKELDGAAGRDGPVIVRDAWLLARDRAAGFAAAFDRVLDDLPSQRALPTALTRIVGIGPDARAASEDPAPTPWGEPPDVLLSKPANAEQVAIVRALDRHGAVLVQGPPGTGKSHTIANLIGHLVAQGKRVLVTSQATKALRVLREHVVEELRPLCVALLDNDLEGRAQLEQAVRVIVHRLSTTSEERLTADLGSLEAERARLVEETGRLAGELRAARESEYRPIRVDGEELTPADAARFVERNGARLDWIPGPLTPGAAIPLPSDELAELYATNGTISSDDQQELELPLPPPELLPGADEVDAIVELVSTRVAESARFWTSAPELGEAQALRALSRAVAELIRELAALAPWQREIVAAGHAGGGEEAVWRQLAAETDRAAAALDEARPLLVEHGPTIDPALDAALPRRETAETLADLHAQVSAGGTVGGLSLLFRSKRKQVLDGCRVNGAPPTEAAHFAALLRKVRLDETRAELGQRWARQGEPVGLPTWDSFPEPAERSARAYTDQCERLLTIWPRRWRHIEAQLASLGFRWEEFRADEVARTKPAAPFARDLEIVAGPLLRAVDRRLEAVGRLEALRRMKALAEELEAWKPRACQSLRRAVTELDRDAYRRALAQVDELRRKRATLDRRRALLAKLAAAAPAWAAAIESRRGTHGAPSVPSDLPEAWRWRQLHEELERRGGRDERALALRLDASLGKLRETTVALVDRKAWLAQLRRTGLEARQALIGWADTQRKIGKGTGKRAPALQIKARELLTRAREAVPVWIMPLARVAESFDPRHAKFDVVIIDEASQCDLGGLLALYLGEQAVIVGDHEQVSPSAIGETVEDTNALISQFLGGIPNSHLYDGQTSVYDLARQSFGGTIGLREHFRCVPDIIEFSNQLSYSGEIRALRDPATARRPHAVEYQVPAALEPARSGKVNDAEARAVAALVAAAIASPEYEGKTFGAISLLGDDQAVRIQTLVQTLVPLDELERRRFVAGNPAHFQGDERDVVFLSMVDVSEGRVLPLQERTSFKQRYNVAASRARDQLWLVHSLDPARDLQVGDLRRRLIEHVRAPAAQRRAERAPRARSPFEQEVMDRLAAAGFRVDAGVQVGSYKIDLVVSDGTNQAAIECDGDRFLPLERIPEDIARQATLERVGWRFIRVRATRFVADPDDTLDWVLREIRRLGIRPTNTDDAPASGDADGENLRNKVVRRAWQIMREHDWTPAAEPAQPPPAEEDAPTDPLAPGELLFDDTTEPGFVLLEQADDRRE